MFSTTERAARTPHLHVVDDRPWLAYLRLSKLEALDLRGLTREERLTRTLAKLEGQREEIEDWAEANGKRLGEVFIDPGLSASKRKVIRPDWLRMMTAAGTGSYAGVVQVAVDRFTRTPREIEDLIDLAERHRLSIAGVRNGLFDLNTASGRREARGAATAAASESDVMGERIRATLHRKMRQGKPMGGGRSFGFETGGQTVRESEAAVVREVARRFVAGETAVSIVANLNARGVRNSRGNAWEIRTLIRMLGQARYGGNVTLRGEVVGTIPGEPILDVETYETVQALIAARRTGRRPTGRFPLTGLVTCGRCGHLMNGATRTKIRADGTRAREYRCPPQLGGCALSIDATKTEEIVDLRMVEHLSDPDNARKIASRNAALTEERAGALAEVARLQGKIDDLEDRWANDEISDAARTKNVATLTKRRDAAQATLDGLAPGSVVFAFDAARVWRLAEPEQRRALLQSFHVEIVVNPYRPGVQRYDKTRVKVAPKG